MRCDPGRDPRLELGGRDPQSRDHEVVPALVPIPRGAEVAEAASTGELHHLERADDATDVRRIDAPGRIGIVLSEPRDERLGIAGARSPARTAGSVGGNSSSSTTRAVVEAASRRRGAARRPRARISSDRRRGPTAGTTRPRTARRGRRCRSCGEGPERAPRRRLGGADVHPAVDLHRVDARRSRRAAPARRSSATSVFPVAVGPTSASTTGGRAGRSERGSAARAAALELTRARRPGGAGGRR